MPASWDPKSVLSLCTDPGNNADWRCVGTTTYSTLQDGTTVASDAAADAADCPDTSVAKHRCSRLIQSSEHNKIAKLVSEMATQMPDHVDHNVLLHLARACLCVDTPEPHRGSQEADVIYTWTELLAAEAERVRAEAAHSSEAVDSYDEKMYTITPFKSILDNLPTPKAFRGVDDDGRSEPSESSTDSRNPDTALRPGPSVISATAEQPTPFSPLPNLTSGDTIRNRRMGNCSVPATPTTTLTIVPPFDFPSHPTHPLPPSPPNSASKSSFPLRCATDLCTALPPPLTATTIETSTVVSSNSSVATPHSQSSFTGSRQHHGYAPDIAMPRPLHFNSVPPILALEHLEEYNRLLQEAQERHAVLIQQAAELRGELCEISRLQNSNAGEGEKHAESLTGELNVDKKGVLSPFEVFLAGLQQLLMSSSSGSVVTQIDSLLHV